MIQREETKKDSFSEVRFLCSKHLSKQNICVADKPQIICTNIGLLDPEFFVEAEHRDWIWQNSVWVDVDEPLELLNPAIAEFPWMNPKD